MQANDFEFFLTLKRSKEHIKTFTFPITIQITSKSTCFQYSHPNSIQSMTGTKIKLDIYHNPMDCESSRVQIGCFRLDHRKVSSLSLLLE